MRLLWRSPNFRRLWGANLCSSLAGWALGIALSVHVFETTRSPIATSGLLIAGSIPAVALGSVAGVLADRVDRVRLLQVVSWLRVLVVASLWFAGDSGTWRIYLIVFIQSSAMQFFGPAEQATIADVVARDDLPAAAGANSTATNITRLIAPAIGGALMTLGGFAWTTALITAMLTIAAVLLTRLDRPKHSRPAGNRSFLQDWHIGLTELRTNPTTAAIATLQVLDACKEGALTALFPVLMLGVINTSSAYMGIVNSSFAATAIFAGPVVGLVLRRCGYRSPIAGGAALTGLLLLCLTMHPDPAIALASFLLAGFPFTISWVASNTLLLLRTPNQLRARTVGSISALYATTSILSAATAGVAAERFGTTTVLAVAACFQIAAGPIFLLMSRHIVHDQASDRRPAPPLGRRPRRSRRMFARQRF